MNLKEKIREVQDFPKEGISFKDITSLLADGEAFAYSIDALYQELEGLDYDVFVGPEARGFIFGTPLAVKAKKGFIPVRKPGKLPAETFRYEYALEYGTDILEIHKDAISPGQKVVIIDDLLATGGTINAVTKMIEEMGGEIVKILFVMELPFLNGRALLEKYDVTALVSYDE